MRVEFLQASLVLGSMLKAMNLPAQATDSMVYLPE